MYAMSGLLTAVSYDPRSSMRMVTTVFGAAEAAVTALSRSKSIFSFGSMKQSFNLDLVLKTKCFLKTKSEV